MQINADLNQNDHMDHSLSNSWNYEPRLVEPHKTDGSWWRGLTECGPLENGMETTSAFLPWEPHEQYEEAKKYDTERWTPQVGRYPICLLEKSREVAPEEMKSLRQSGNSA